MVGDEKLCTPCVEQHTQLYYFEAVAGATASADGDFGLLRGRSLRLVHASLSERIGLENIVVFREATEADISHVQATVD